MITKEQFLAMKPGTVFYVAAPGRLGLESNNLSAEVFIKTLISHDKLHLQTECGGLAFEYGKNGASFYLDKDEAENFMAERHVNRHKAGLKLRATQIEKLKQEIANMEANGPGEPDYLYHDRTFNPQGSKL